MKTGKIFKEIFPPPPPPHFKNPLDLPTPVSLYHSLTLPLINHIYLYYVRIVMHYASNRKIMYTLAAGRKKQNPESTKIKMKKNICFILRN